MGLCINLGMFSLALHKDLCSLFFKDVYKRDDMESFSECVHVNALAN